MGGALFTVLAHGTGCMKAAEAGIMKLSAWLGLAMAFSAVFSQAGAGIVAVSDEESELQEVGNKLAALKKAVEMAKGIR